MKRAYARGFTLVELLVVVAIIGILASLVFVGGPRMIEKSKIASLMNTCNQVRTACVAYAANKNKSGSFPPMYGYRMMRDPIPAGTTDEFLYSLKPYMARLDLFRNMGAYDVFSVDSHDTDRDGRLSPLEFCPVGQSSGPNMYTFPTTLYTGNNLAAEVSGQLAQQRPLVYIPVNSEQASLVAQYYYTVAKDLNRPQDGWYATHWLPNEVMPGGKPNPLTKLRFPPSKYDDFVLISVGPQNNTGGILTAPASFMADLNANVAPENHYLVLALRAYFLATRDMNGNDQLDFDFRNRTRGGEGKAAAYPTPNMNLLPDGTSGPGPIIYRQGSSS